MELGATYASLARILFEARQNSHQSVVDDDPELVSDLLNKALMLYQQCDNEAEELTAQQLRMWVDALILTAKDLVHKVLVERDSSHTATSGKVTQRRLDNSTRHLKQVVQLCLRWQLCDPLDDAFRTANDILETAVSCGIGWMSYIQQILQMLNKCASKLRDNHLPSADQLCAIIVSELQHVLKQSVKLLKEAPKKSKCWKRLYLQALKLESANDTTASRASSVLTLLNDIAASECQESG